MKPDLLKLNVRVDGVRNIKRATKAAKKLAKAFEKLSVQTEKTEAAFQKLKNTLPVLLEGEVENDVSNSSN